MKMTTGKRENFLENKMVEKQEDSLSKCSFSWEKLIEMKDKNVEFFAGDGYKRLRIIDIDEKTKSIHMICELGKISWPLGLERLEEKNKISHRGKADFIPYK